MKKYLPLSVVLIVVIGVASTLLPPRAKSDFDVASFGRLPVLLNGRLKPFDTVARTSLLMLQGRQRVATPEGRALQPIEWLLDVLYAPAAADTYRHFLIENPEVLELFKLRPADGDGGKRFSYAQLAAGVSEVERQAKLADEVEPARRTPFQAQVLQLRNRLILYQRLKYTMQPDATPGFFSDVVALEAALPANLAAVRARQRGQPHDEAAVARMAAFVRQFDFMASAGYLIAVPSAGADADMNNWKTPGQALVDSIEAGKVNLTVLAYAQAGKNWGSAGPGGTKAAGFNVAVATLHERFDERYATALAKAGVETRFNSAQPFYTSMVLFVMAAIAALVSWLAWPDGLRRIAFWLVALAFVLTTAGIATRMWIEGRPPVTNLYSSALFVGWVAVALCLVIEAIYKNAVASVAAAAVGFCALVIAHHLSMGGDTMEMMRAVLDSNFWLATHVVTMAMGYGAAFLAGFLAIIYIVRGAFTKSLDRRTADGLVRMVYGVVCFATLFNLAGTVLGGIWADQSWGRFWGWDPKENGALVIVLWYSLILHARWAGMVRQRGLMNLAVFGNVVTAASWFGVNMLGVGLHSYGFTNSAAFWLVAFTLSQLAVMMIAALPLEKWRSGAAIFGPVPSPRERAPIAGEAEALQGAAR
ncbi:cytochrome c biogenesis protein [Opitutus terrae]|uniref:Cytochrome c assembly protein n=1 Tax=Opitutus terrae (strain DSM 11246 / JCM 15787 / PB90-1) TaxID=452637 RepID=B1ZRM9_OPITP|nr:cytochrome c biogenesis protein CcsA [Opitutus terrae]ACB77677.1 cytochrome c assembly protein [Opitutus terrae PB90-1]